MKILVFSDSHGRESNMGRALAVHRDADAVFHLGDGTTEFELLCREYPNMAAAHVPGNYEDCFGRSPFSYFITEVGPYRFFLTHGHMFSVKEGLNILINFAKGKGADVILYGHSHTKYYEYIAAEDESDKPVHIFNPGSITRPRDGAPSYGIIEIRDNGILFSHGSI